MVEPRGKNEYVGKYDPEQGVILDENGVISNKRGIILDEEGAISHDSLINDDDTSNEPVSIYKRRVSENH